jgi:hypothetical protein
LVSKGHLASGPGNHRTCRHLESGYSTVETQVPESRILYEVVELAIDRLAMAATSLFCCDRSTRDAAKYTILPYLTAFNGVLPAVDRASATAT